jgi:hypothetical protein
MEKQLLYCAVLEDDGTIISVNTSRKDCEEFIMDYFGINPNKTYTDPSEFIGFTKIEYSEFEDELEGYYIFSNGTEKTRVNLFTKILNEKP